MKKLFTVLFTATLLFIFSGATVRAEGLSTDSQASPSEVIAPIEHIQGPVLYVGQLAEVVLDTITYWETSQNFGTGKYGECSRGDMVFVTRVAYLDDAGNVLDTYCLDDGFTEIDLSRRYMLHIWKDGYDLGWVYPTAISGPTTICPPEEFRDL